MYSSLRSPLVVLAAAAAPLGAQSTRCADATITGQRVGVVVVGMALDALRGRCPLIRDTTELSEGDLERVIYALVAGDTLRIEVRRDSVRRIDVRRPRFATSDSIHVGMTLSRFLMGRRATPYVGEGKVHLFDRRHCGDSFGLSAEAYRRVSRLTASSLARLPSSTTIDQILVTGISTRPLGEPCP